MTAEGAPTAESLERARHWLERAFGCGTHDDSKTVERLADAFDAVREECAVIAEDMARTYVRTGFHDEAHGSMSVANAIRGRETQG